MRKLMVPGTGIEPARYQVPADFEPLVVGLLTTQYLRGVFDFRHILSNLLDNPFRPAETRPETSSPVE